MGALFVIVAGMLSAVQAGVNAALGKQIGQFQAGLVTFTLSIAMFLVAGLATGRLGWPGGAKIEGVPWWGWTGGVLGAVYVLAQLFLADTLGGAVFIGLVVTASTVTSLALDHYGLVGFEVHPVNAGRIAGAVLMIVGVGLIARF